MNAITIYLNSVVCDAASKCTQEIRELNSLAKKRFVEVEFFHEKVRLVAHYTHTINVPKKATNPSGLVEWLRNKIETAWDKWE